MPSAVKIDDGIWVKVCLWCGELKSLDEYYSRWKACDDHQNTDSGFDGCAKCTERRDAPQSKQPRCKECDSRGYAIVDKKTIKKQDREARRIAISEYERVVASRASAKSAPVPLITPVAVVPVVEKQVMRMVSLEIVDPGDDMPGLRIIYTRPDKTRFVGVIALEELK